MNVDLSIIIVNYNVKFFLDQCLSSIYRSIVSYGYEVIVVDNNSSDDSAEFVRSHYPEVLWIQNQNNEGFSKANNIGITESKGEYILLLNPDTILGDHTLQNCMEFLTSRDDVGAMGVAMYDGSGNFLPESKRGFPSPWVSFCKLSGLSKVFSKSKLFNEYNLGYLHNHSVCEVSVLSGAFMLMPRSVLDQVGLLDEDYFMYGEDIDLSYKIKKTGKPLFYLGTEKIIHFKGESTRKSSLKYYRTFYNAMRIFTKKHFAGNKGSIYQSVLSLAIFVRGLISFVGYVLLKGLRPLFIVSVVFFSFYFIRYLWGLLYHDNPLYYPANYNYLNAPFYSIVQILALFFSGYFHKRSFKNLFTGVIAGTLITMLIYAVLPDEFRSSRVLPILGSLVVLSILKIVDFLDGLIRNKNREERILLAGIPSEVAKVKKLLADSGRSDAIVGLVSLKPTEEEGFIGHMEDVQSIIRVCNANTLVYCSKEGSGSSWIKYLTLFGGEVSFKLFSGDAIAIIASQNSKDKGEVYTSSLKYEISDPFKRDLKRIIDFGCSTLTMLFFPVLFVIWSKPGKVWNKMLKVWKGDLSFVGYIPFDEKINELPHLKEGILSHRKIAEIGVSRKIHILNILYALEYTPFTDLTIIFSQFKFLDQ